MKESTKNKIHDTIQKYMEQKHRKSALIIAHRGGAVDQSKVENTLEAFQTAIHKKVKMVEFDVRRTLDKQLIVFHNNHIEKIRLNTLTYQQICNISGKDGYHVPLLKDVLEICSDKIMLDIELKESGYENQVLSLLEQYFCPEHYIITSFLDSVIMEIKRINPAIRAGLLIGKEHASLKQRLSEVFPFRRLRRTGADFIVPNYRLVTPWLLHSCKKMQYNIYVWTVNGDSLYSKLIHKKVAGIITDFPERYDGKYTNASKEELVC